MIKVRLNLDYRSRENLALDVDMVIQSLIQILDVGRDLISTQLISATDYKTPNTSDLDLESISNRFISTSTLINTDLA